MVVDRGEGNQHRFPTARTDGWGLMAEMLFLRSTKSLFSFLCAFSLIAGLLLGSGNAWGQTPEAASDSSQDLPYDEAEAQSIDRMLMCPVCPAETIDQAQVELARQMRRLVRDMLTQGATRGEILEYFADRYPGVLAAPPKSGFNLLVWIVPPAGVLAALAVGLLVIRAMTASKPAPVTINPIPGDDLRPYLAAVDRDLGLAGSPDRAPSSGPPAGLGLRPSPTGPDTSIAGIQSVEPVENSEPEGEDLIR